MGQKINPIGLRLGINRVIFNELISAQIAANLMYAVYENDDIDSAIDSGFGSTFECSLGLINPYFKIMSFQLLSGYNLNGIKNHNNEELLNSLFVGFGIQLIGNWF